MQACLFDTPHATAPPPPPPAAYRYPYWMEDAPGKVADAGGLFDAPATHYTRYRSGVSAFWDIQGYRLAGEPIMATATEVGLRPRVIDALVRTLNEGNRVAIDSGAFGAFQEERRIDFEVEVFPVYEALLTSTDRPELLTVVAPDIVGDAAGSLALQLAHMDRLRRWITAGVEVIVPIQLGGDSVATHATLEATLGELSFTVGIPANSKAWTLADLVPFVRNARPARIHLLGMSAARRTAAWAYRLQEIHPALALSCDACQIVAHVGKGRKLTDRCHSRLDAVLTQAALRGSPLSGEDADALPTVVTFRHCLWDEPNFLTPALAEDLARELGQPDWAERMAAAVPYGLQDIFAQMDPDEEWLQDRLIAVAPTIYLKWLTSILTGPIRAYELSRLASA